MSNAENYPIGAKLCAVYTVNRNAPHVVDVEVTKVGRRWVTFVNDRGHEDRFDPDDMSIDDKGLSSPGRVYNDRAEYEESTETARLWKALYARLCYTPPEGLTPDGVRAIAAALKMEQYLS